MRAFTVFLGSLFFPLWLFAQEAPSPEDVVSFEIPWCLAKVPERSDFNGVWLRADGTYRLEIKDAEIEDATVVKYFNPGVINVESAVMSGEDGAPSLTVILRDEGYPGSTYQLSYFSQRGVLIGTYTRPGSAPQETMFLKKKAG
jgi:hypothetical protein